MSRSLTPDDAQRALTAHLTEKGEEIFAQYGPVIGRDQLERILNDRTCVRYPCALAFAAEPLQPGEFAYPVRNGPRLEDGFTLYVHPCFQGVPDQVPYLVFYQLVVVNYGDVATADDAETFGAAALGLTKEAYYEAICRLADQVATTADQPAVSPAE